ncbi:MAG TPA: HD domain-containing protein [Candidatus Omnitrophota bacterium]|nr:HD domain-containing protein [Candidatus Omnitrophota bacterium]HPS36883.1 HD domain-containing protein [Candidatus Omnitrophota bacterium]
MRKNRGPDFGLRATALGTVFVFIVTSVTWSLPVEAAAPEVSARTAPRVLSSSVTVPVELGTIEEASLPKQAEGRGLKAGADGSASTVLRVPSSKEFVVLIQDAHAVVAAQESIRKLIGHFDKTCGIKLVAIEGAKEKLDPTLLRMFPNAAVKQRVLSAYLERGELTGPQMAAIFDANERDYRGMEDWSLYEENYRAWLRAQEPKAALLATLEGFRKKLDPERLTVYSATLNEFHERCESFRSEKISFGEFLIYLANFRKQLSQSGHQEFLKLLDSVGYAASGKQEELDPMIKAMAVEFKTKFVRGSGVKDEMNFYNRFQQFLTGQMDGGKFLQYMIEFGGAKGFRPKLTPQMQALLGHTETLSAMKGSKLFADLQAGLLAIEGGLIIKPEEKALAEKYHKLFLLKDLTNLELTHEQLARYQKEPDAYLELLADKAFRENLRQAIGFYQLALERDRAFYENLMALLRGESSRTPNSEQRTAIVVAGGFHTEGLKQLFREKGVDYVVVSPRIAELSGQRNYDKIMKNDVSYKEFLKTTYYDAFIRHSTRALVGEFDQADFLRNIKGWRDEVIRDLARRGRIAEAGHYTQYLDALSGIFAEKFGKGAPKSKEEILRILDKELAGFRDKSLEAIWQHFESELGRFMEGLKALMNKKQLTAERVSTLLDNAGAAKRSMLAEPAASSVLSPGTAIISAELPGIVPSEAKDVFATREEMTAALESIAAGKPVVNPLVVDTARVLKQAAVRSEQHAGSEIKTLPAAQLEKTKRDPAYFGMNRNQYKKTVSSLSSVLRHERRAEPAVEISDGIRAKMFLNPAILAAGLVAMAVVGAEGASQGAVDRSVEFSGNAAAVVSVASFLDKLQKVLRENHAVTSQTRQVATAKAVVAAETSVKAPAGKNTVAEMTELRIDELANALVVAEIIDPDMLDETKIELTTNPTVRKGLVKMLQQEIGMPQKLWTGNFLNETRKTFAEYNAKKNAKKSSESREVIVSETPAAGVSSEGAAKGSQVITVQKKGFKPVAVDHPELVALKVKPRVVGYFGKIDRSYGKYGFRLWPGQKKEVETLWMATQILKEREPTPEEEKALAQIRKDVARDVERRNFGQTRLGTATAEGGRGLIPNQGGAKKASSVTAASAEMLEARSAIDAVLFAAGKAKLDPNVRSVLYDGLTKKQATFFNSVVKTRANDTKNRETMWVLLQDSDFQDRMVILYFYHRYLRDGLSLPPADRIDLQAGTYHQTWAPGIFEYPRTLETFLYSDALYNVLEKLSRNEKITEADRNAFRQADTFSKNVESAAIDMRNARKAAEDGDWSGASMKLLSAEQKCAKLTAHLDQYELVPARFMLARILDKDIVHRKQLLKLKQIPQSSFGIPQEFELQRMAAEARASAFSSALIATGGRYELRAREGAAFGLMRDSRQGTFDDAWRRLQRMVRMLSPERKQYYQDPRGWPDNEQTAYIQKLDKMTFEGLGDEVARFERAKVFEDGGFSGIAEPAQRLVAYIDFLSQENDYDETPEHLMHHMGLMHPAPGGHVSAVLDPTLVQEYAMFFRKVAEIWSKLAPDLSQNAAEGRPGSASASNSRKEIRTGMPMEGAEISERAQAIEAIQTVFKFPSAGELGFENGEVSVPAGRLYIERLQAEESSISAEQSSNPKFFSVDGVRNFCYQDGALYLKHSVTSGGVVYSMIPSQGKPERVLFPPVSVLARLNALNRTELAAQLEIFRNEEFPDKESWQKEFRDIEALFSLRAVLQKDPLTGELGAAIEVGASDPRIDGSRPLMIPGVLNLVFARYFYDYLQNGLPVETVVFENGEWRGKLYFIPATLKKAGSDIRPVREMVAGIPMPLPRAVFADSFRAEKRTFEVTHEPFEVWAGKIAGQPLAGDAKPVAEILGAPVSKRWSLIGMYLTFREFFAHDESFQKTTADNAPLRFGPVVEALSTSSDLKTLEGKPAFDFLQRLQVYHLSGEGRTLPLPYWSLSANEPGREPVLFFRSVPGILSGRDLTQVLAVNGMTVDGKSIRDGADVTEFYFVDGIYVGYGVTRVNKGDLSDLEMQYKIFANTDHPDYGSGRGDGLAEAIYRTRIELWRSLVPRDVTAKVTVKAHQLDGHITEQNPPSFYEGLGFKASNLADGKPDYKNGLVLSLRGFRKERPLIMTPETAAGAFRAEKRGAKGRPADRLESLFAAVADLSEKHDQAMANAVSKANGNLNDLVTALGEVERVHEQIVLLIKTCQKYAAADPLALQIFEQYLTQANDYHQSSTGLLYLLLDRRLGFDIPSRSLKIFGNKDFVRKVKALSLETISARAEAAWTRFKDLRNNVSEKDKNVIDTVILDRETTLRKQTLSDSLMLFRAGMDLGLFPEPHYPGVRSRFYVRTLREWLRDPQSTNFEAARKIFSDLYWSAFTGLEEHSEIVLQDALEAFISGRSLEFLGVDQAGLENNGDAMRLMAERYGYLGKKVMGERDRRRLAAMVLRGFGRILMILSVGFTLRAGWSGMNWYQAMRRDQIEMAQKIEKNAAETLKKINKMRPKAMGRGTAGTEGGGPRNAGFNSDGRSERVETGGGDENSEGRTLALYRHRQDLKHHFGFDYLPLMGFRYLDPATGEYGPGPTDFRQYTSPTGRRAIAKMDLFPDQAEARSLVTGLAPGTIVLEARSESGELAKLRYDPRGIWEFSFDGPVGKTITIVLGDQKNGDLPSPGQAVMFNFAENRAYSKEEVMRLLPAEIRQKVVLAQKLPAGFLREREMLNLLATLKYSKDNRVDGLNTELPFVSRVFMSGATDCDGFGFLSIALFWLTDLETGVLQAGNLISEGQFKEGVYPHGWVFLRDGKVRDIPQGVKDLDPRVQSLPPVPGRQTPARSLGGTLKSIFDEWKSEIQRFNPLPGLYQFFKVYLVFALLGGLLYRWVLIPWKAWLRSSDRAWFGASTETLRGRTLRLILRDNGWYHPPAGSDPEELIASGKLSPKERAIADLLALAAKGTVPYEPPTRAQFFKHLVRFLTISPFVIDVMEWLTHRERGASGRERYFENLIRLARATGGENSLTLEKFYTRMRNIVTNSLGAYSVEVSRGIELRTLTDLIGSKFLQKKIQIVAPKGGFKLHSETNLHRAAPSGNSRETAELAVVSLAGGVPVDQIAQTASAKVDGNKVVKTLPPARPRNVSASIAVDVQAVLDPSANNLDQWIQQLVNSLALPFAEMHWKKASNVRYSLVSLILFMPDGRVWNIRVPSTNGLNSAKAAKETREFVMSAVRQFLSKESGVDFGSMKARMKSYIPKDQVGGVWNSLSPAAQQQLVVSGIGRRGEGGWTNAGSLVIDGNPEIVISVDPLEELGPWLTGRLQKPVLGWKGQSALPLPMGRFNNGTAKLSLPLVKLADAKPSSVKSAAKESSAERAEKRTPEVPERIRDEEEFFATWDAQLKKAKDPDRRAILALGRKVVAEGEIITEAKFFTELMKTKEALASALEAAGPYAVLFGRPHTSRRWVWSNIREGLKAPVFTAYVEPFKPYYENLMRERESSGVRTFVIVDDACYSAQQVVATLREIARHYPTAKAIIAIPFMTSAAMKSIRETVKKDLPEGFSALVLPHREVKTLEDILSPDEKELFRRRGDALGKAFGNDKTYSSRIRTTVTLFSHKFADQWSIYQLFAQFFKAPVPPYNDPASEYYKAESEAYAAEVAQGVSQPARRDEKREEPSSTSEVQSLKVNAGSPELSSISNIKPGTLNFPAAVRADMAPVLIDPVARKAAEQRIEKWRGWAATQEQIMPSELVMSRGVDDVAAVVAGSKPAALVSGEDVVRHEEGKALIQIAKERGLSVETLTMQWKDKGNNQEPLRNAWSLIVAGTPEVARQIVLLLEEKATGPDGRPVAIGSVEYHRMLGRLLGYPDESIEQFAKMIESRDQFFGRGAQVFPSVLNTQTPAAEVHMEIPADWHVDPSTIVYDANTDPTRKKLKTAYAVSMILLNEKGEALFAFRNPKLADNGGVWSLPSASIAGEDDPNMLKVISGKVEKNLGVRVKAITTIGKRMGFRRNADGTPWQLLMHDVFVQIYSGEVSLKETLTDEGVPKYTKFGFFEPRAFLTGTEGDFTLHNAGDCTKCFGTILFGGDFNAFAQAYEKNSAPRAESRSEARGESGSTIRPTFERLTGPETMGFFRELAQIRGLRAAEIRRRLDDRIYQDYRVFLRTILALDRSTIDAAAETELDGVAGHCTNVLAAALQVRSMAKPAATDGLRRLEQWYYLSGLLGTNQGESLVRDLQARVLSLAPGDPDKAYRMLYWADLLHDIGKFRNMRIHDRVGSDMIRELGLLDGLVADGLISPADTEMIRMAIRYHTFFSELAFGELSDVSMKDFLNAPEIRAFLSADGQQIDIERFRNLLNLIYVISITDQAGFAEDRGQLQLRKNEFQHTVLDEVVRLAEDNKTFDATGQALDARSASGVFDRLERVLASWDQKFDQRTPGYYSEPFRKTLKAVEDGDAVAQDAASLILTTFPRTNVKFLIAVLPDLAWIPAGIDRAAFLRYFSNGQSHPDVIFDVPRQDSVNPTVVKLLALSLKAAKLLGVTGVISIEPEPSAVRKSPAYKNALWALELVLREAYDVRQDGDTVVFVRKNGSRIETPGASVSIKKSGQDILEIRFKEVASSLAPAAHRAEMRKEVRAEARAEQGAVVFKDELDLSAIPELDALDPLDFRRKEASRINRGAQYIYRGMRLRYSSLAETVNKGMSPDETTGLSISLTAKPQDAIDYSIMPAGGGFKKKLLSEDFVCAIVVVEKAKVQIKDEFSSGEITTEEAIPVGGIRQILIFDKRSRHYEIFDMENVHTEVRERSGSRMIDELVSVDADRIAKIAADQGAEAVREGLEKKGRAELRKIGGEISAKSGKFSVEVMSQSDPAAYIQGDGFSRAAERDLGAYGDVMPFVIRVRNLVLMPAAMAAETTDAMIATIVPERMQALDATLGQGEGNLTVAFDPSLAGFAEQFLKIPSERTSRVNELAVSGALNGKVRAALQARGVTVRQAPLNRNFISRNQSNVPYVTGTEATVVTLAPVFDPVVGNVASVGDLFVRDYMNRLMVVAAIHLADIRAGTKSGALAMTPSDICDELLRRLNLFEQKALIQAKGRNFVVSSVAVQTYLRMVAEQSVRTAA